MADLDGSNRSIELSAGYELRTPGLQGTASTETVGNYSSTQRGPERASTGFVQAIQATGLKEVRTIRLKVKPVPGAIATPTRSPSGHAALELSVPDLGPKVGQVVLAIDEHGVVTWNFPLEADARVQVPATRGASGQKRFRIRNFVPREATTAETQRGLFGMLGEKVLKVFIYPITDALIGPAAEQFAANWEGEHRPYRLRSFLPDSYTQEAATDLTADDLRKLEAGPALLFVHGTFSQGHSGFANLPRETLEALHARYGGRVFSFEHFSVSASPEENAKQFLKMLPADLSLNIDIICHSRGGLVARALAGALGTPGLERIKVRRIVFCGAPNHGTALADPDHVTSMIDRVTTLLNLPPLGAEVVITSILEGIITVVKVIGHGALKGLSGLAAMQPNGDFLNGMNASAVLETEFFAVSADFQPTGSLKDLVMGAQNAVFDLVFQNAANDLVVPTLSVTEGVHAAGFPINPANMLRFDRQQHVTHHDFFGRPETSAKFLEWLPG
jgi:pimeloyl-ACP methyl ester carboxylesterase